MSTEKSIRAYPTLPLAPLRAKSFRWIMREKLVTDIYAHVRRGEYGKASELLLIAFDHACVPISSVWRPFLATLRQQVPAHFVGLQIDNVASGMRNEAPAMSSMERVFYDLDRNRMDHAYAAVQSLTMDRGKNLALAHGYRGILVACLREVELDQLVDGIEQCLPSSAHVFRLSESVQFLLSKDDPAMITRHTLRDAEKDLELALKLDQGNTYFLAFYAQVLIALDELPKAKSLLENWYGTKKSLPCLRYVHKT
ncbi:hypothetical protein GGI20_002395 [Coemansia sp. BCRC 34301]|nr:hypothetical protein GGI20_002395 [Coemansia sp. BCRC 34301]